MLTIGTALALRGWVNERDARIAENAARSALIARDSAQIAALRDSVISARANYDTVAKALRSALYAYKASSELTVPKPSLNRPQLVSMLTENVQPAAVIALCQHFVTTADTYKLYADSVMAAQARIIANLQLFPQKVVTKSTNMWKTTAIVSGLVTVITVAIASK